MRRYSRKKNSIKIFAAVTALAALVMGASYYFSGEKNSSAVIAKVNGQEIFQSDIEQKLRGIFEDQGSAVKIPAIDSLPKEVLDVLIKEVYLDNQLSKLAKKSSVAKNKEVVSKVLEAQNRILREAYVKAEISKQVTDQAVSAKYAEISSGLAGKKEYLVFHIVTKTKDEALKLRKDLTAKKKSSFADVAKKYSIDKESAEHGGELGFILEDNMMKEIDDAIVNLKQGEISEPIQTKFGWHLVKFMEVREAQALPFESVKQNIREQLEQDAANEIESKIVKDIKVEVLIKMKEEAAQDSAKSDSDNSAASEPAQTNSDNSLEQPKQSEEPAQNEQQTEQKTEQNNEKSDQQKNEKPTKKEVKKHSNHHKKH